MNDREIDGFEKVEAQLMGFLEEMQGLARKSPDSGMNKFKLKHINSVLSAANGLLTPEQRPFAEFAQFDEVAVPTNSDVLLILRQYANCLDEVRAANTYKTFAGWFWRIDGDQNSRRARPPAKLT